MFLTLVWMTARLVLPLQPQCPHHASAQLAELHSAAGEAVLSVPTTASHAHHAAMAGPLTPGAPADDGPSRTTPCDCVSDCCAATVVAMPASEPPTAGVLNVALGGDVPPRHAAVRLDTRATHRHPPATAPPGFSATA
jgi:hypothetical protein